MSNTFLSTADQLAIKCYLSFQQFPYQPISMHQAFCLYFKGTAEYVEFHKVQDSISISKTKISAYLCLNDKKNEIIKIVLYP